MVTATASSLRPVEETATARRPRALMLMDPLLTLAAQVPAVRRWLRDRQPSGTGPTEETP